MRNTNIKSRFKHNRNLRFVFRAGRTDRIELESITHSDSIAATMHKSHWEVSLIKLVIFHIYSISLTGKSDAKDP
jgi:hypothetical protein